MELVEHVVKLGLAVALLTTVVSVAGGWVLAAFDTGSWDKEIHRADEPLDLTGWRR